VIGITTVLDPIHPARRFDVELTDPDEIGDFLESAFGARIDVSWAPLAHSGGRPRLRHRRTDVGPIIIDHIEVPGRAQMFPDPLGKVVAWWSSSGRIGGECAGLAGRAEAGEITLTAQHDLPSTVYAEDLTVTAVLLDPAVVAGVAAGVPSTEAPMPFRFSTFQPVDADAVRLWQDTVRYVRDSVLADDRKVTPLVVGLASRLLSAVTLSAFPEAAVDHDDAAGRVDARPALLRLAVDYLESNAGNDIALPDIARAVHISPRAVQYMFRRHLGTTPLQYLRQLRLHHAHQDLVRGSRSTDTVTRIAARWGFAHTGRFAVAYREVYGHSPHQTLRA
jgi:AraC-like DNA-binding protein